MRHVVIVGGGITGLAALEWLSADPQLRVTLLESGPRLGGHIRTERVDGLVMEAGPDVMLTAKPAALELASRVGLADRVVSTNPAAKGSYILRRGALRRIPDGLSGLVPSRLAPFVTSPLVSLTGKARVAMDYFIPPRRTDEDESIERFVVRRLGREMYDNLVEPLLSGISAGDGASLSIDAMFPRFRELEREHGGLIRGVLASKHVANRAAKGGAQQAARPSRAPSGTGFAAFPLGLQELVDATEQRILERDPAGERVAMRLGAPVTRILRAWSEQPVARDRFLVVLDSGDGLVADAVILATPAWMSASLVGDIDPELGRQLAAIEYTSTVTMSLAYRRDAVARPLDATGYVVPRIERRPVLASTWVSSKFTGRAPDDLALFRLFLGGVGRTDVQSRTDAELLEIAQAEMRSVMGVVAPPVLTRINRLERALPQYTVGHRARMQAIQARTARTAGLYLAGSLYTGLGIPDCVRSGVETAARLVADLAAMPPHSAPHLPHPALS